MNSFIERAIFFDPSVADKRSQRLKKASKNVLKLLKGGKGQEIANRNEIKI